MRINEEFEIFHDGECWELRQYSDKQPNHLCQNPKGKKVRKRWYPSLETAAMALVDLNAAHIGTAEEIRAEMAKTRQAIVDAIGRGA